MIYLDKLKKLEARAKEIEAQLSDPGSFKDQNKLQGLSKEMGLVRPIVASFHAYQKAQKEIADLKKSLEDPGLDEEMKHLYQEEIQGLQAKAKKLTEDMETRLLRGSDPHAGRDVIVEVRAGTGGEEAALFAADLFRMYSRFASGHGLKVEMLDSSPTGIGGFKEIIFSVSGQEAYSSLKYESGIHRVQRVPRTESSGRIHTSAVTVAVLPEADEADLTINPQDLKIDVFRASGAGGQHVNKTESAVRITHLPTGLVVSCQDERSQHKNKAKAMRVLRARIFDAAEQKKQAELAKQRKQQVGTGDRSGKIRTYNFPDQRVTDHRIGLTLHSLDAILDGRFEPLVQALEQDEREKKLTDAA